MKLILMLIRTSLPYFLIAAVSSILSGAGFSGIMAVIHLGIKTGLKDTNTLIPLFLLSWGGYGLFSVLTSYSITKLSQAVIYDMRIGISKKIMNASFKKIENRTPEMLAILTQDIQTITWTISRLPSALTGLTTIIGCYIYLSIISVKLVLITMALFGGAMFFFVVPMKVFHKRMTNVRNLWDHLYLYFRSLTDGLKELKLNSRLRRSFFGDMLAPSCKSQKEYIIKAEFRHSFFSRLGEMLLLMGMAGLLLSIKTNKWITFQEFSQYLTITVFTLSPLATLVGYFPSLSTMKIALDKIKKAELELQNLKRSDEECLEPLEENAESPFVSLKSVTHTYFHEKQDKFFKLGPIDLTIEKGSITFLVGGNGSGKSTLAKVLCGLYPPESGEIECFGKKISPDNIDSYRENFSAIFTDYYLFDSVQYIDNEVIAAKADKYLKLLEIDHKVSVTDKKISNIRLSEGQMKRLALFKALLEDKPFYIFDEWAAGQDPYYKKIFYNNILKELKEMGKTIFVISHDEQYFDCGDSVIILREGNIIKDGVFYA